MHFLTGILPQLRVDFAVLVVSSRTVAEKGSSNVRAHFSTILVLTVVRFHPLPRAGAAGLWPS